MKRSYTKRKNCLYDKVKQGELQFTQVTIYTMFSSTVNQWANVACKLQKAGQGLGMRLHVLPMQVCTHTHTLHAVYVRDNSYNHRCHCDAKPCDVTAEHVHAVSTNK